jgi:hypothetical protein
LAACPGSIALVVMPDHLHLLHRADVRRPLVRVLAAHTRRRRSVDDAAIGFGAVPEPEEVRGADKIRRLVRYVYLNPCRARLVDDPLAWPLSTYRDLLGLAVTPVLARHSDPPRVHAYVSSDPTVQVGGTELPVARAGDIALHEVYAAVSALCRAPVADLQRRGPPRTLFLACAAQLTSASPVENAAYVGLHRTQVARSTATPNQLTLVARVGGDPRFAALAETGRWAHRG